MVCQELLSSPRLEGVRVFVIARVLTKQLNIRAYDIEKVMEQFSDLQCDQILPRPGTKVFFGDRLCTHVSVIYVQMLTFRANCVNLYIL